MNKEEKELLLKDGGNSESCYIPNIKPNFVINNMIILVLDYGEEEV